MTEFGSDVAFVCSGTSYAGKYVDGVNEAREANPHYGRAAHFDLPVNAPEEIKEALSRVAETFGRMDVLMDAYPLTWDEKTDTTSALRSCRERAQALVPFFQAKQRGRVIHFMGDTCLTKLGLPLLPESVRLALEEHVRTLALEYRQWAVTVNALALGVTEDFILRHFPQSGSIRKSLTELQKVHPEIKLVESTEVALGAAYLASALSASLTGQTLRLTHGFHL